MHSILFVLLPPTTADIIGETTRLLSPYDGELQLAPYKRHFDENQVVEWKKEFGKSDLAALAEELHEQFKSEYGVDEKGIYEISTFNEMGRWDGWGPKKYFKNPATDVGRWGKDLERSIAIVSTLKDKDIPYSIVTPDGQWHSLQWDFGYKPVLNYTPETGDRLHPQNVEPLSKWTEHARHLLTNYQDHIVFVLDCHS